nr:MAG TPA: hypothetical protein [Caudoviricetes sp.]
MNPLSNMRQLVYVINALFSIDCFITDLQLQAKDKLAESEKVDRALLNLRLQLRRSLDEGFGVFGDGGETDER